MPVLIGLVADCNPVGRRQGAFFFRIFETDMDFELSSKVLFPRFGHFYVLLHGSEMLEPVLILFVIVMIINCNCLFAHFF